VSIERRTAREAVGSSARRLASYVSSASDGFIEWPYRPAGVPGRLAGREQIREFLTAQAKGFIRFDEYRNMVIHETTDPEVVIVEYDAHGTVIATGAPLHQTIIAVFRIRDGLVVSYRDYLNPLVLAEALASSSLNTSPPAPY
jgi:ketosteroid isomerase-like protein